MKARRPDLLVVAFSLVGVLAVLLVFAFGFERTREEELQRAEGRLGHFAEMLAEHSSRALESLDILLGELARDLSVNRHDWQDWEPSQAWEYISERHSRSLPQLRALAVFDQHGKPRMLSTAFPIPEVNVSERPYFQALRSGSETSVSGPFVSYVGKANVFALARRVPGRTGEFSGAALAMLELAYFQDFCWPIRLDDEFDAVLLNATGQVIASCRPVDLSAQSPVIGAPASAVLAGGALQGITLQPGIQRVGGHLLALASVHSHPELRILTVLPERAALSVWERRRNEFAFFAAAIVVILLVGGWLVRRQVIELAAVSAQLGVQQRDLAATVRQATSELAREKEAAELSSVAKSRFLAAASHDLRQPLHALSLFVADLQRQVASGHLRDLDRLAAQINSSLSSLAGMLDALLDISRLDMGGMQPEWSHFAVQTVFERTYLAFRPAATVKRIRFHVRPSALCLHADLHMVERLLSNLVSNAIRYTPEGGTVVLAARLRGGRVRVEVRDNGLGIATEHQEVIFKEFFQVGNSARDQRQGLGLGLSIVQRLVSAMAAGLQLRSAPGKGTCFAVDFERGQAQEALVSRMSLRVVGQGEDFERIVELTRGWGYRVAVGWEGLEAPAMVLVGADLAAEARQRLPSGCALVVLGGEAGVGWQTLPLPLRPAKLRALLHQIQKTLSKSMR